MIKIFLGIIITFLFLFVYEYTNKNVNFHKLRNPHLYQIDLKPEHMNINNKKHFFKRVDIGKKIAGNSRLIIAGLCRDIKPNIPMIKKRLEKTGSFFKDYKIVLFENDSSDGTREELKKWGKTDIINCCNFGSCGCKLNESRAVSTGALSRKRIQKMTVFRNMYLDHIKKYYSDFDYLMVIDMDEEGAYSNLGILHTLSYQNWDMMFAKNTYSIPGTLGMVINSYDVLATEKKISNEKSFSSFLSFVYNHFNLNFKLNSNTNVGDNPIFFETGFGGMAIYKISSILNCRYSDKYKCEHIGLHKCMKDHNHGKIYLNPAMVIYMGHQGPRNIKSLIT